MEIKPIYLFYGEEKFLLYKDVAFFRDYFAKEGVSAEEFDGAKVSLSAVLASASEMPLFGGKRLIIVDHAPWFSRKTRKGQEDDEGDFVDSNAEELLSYAADPNEDTCLVFISDTADKRMKTVKAIETSGKVRKYEPKKSYELPDYVRKYMDRAKKRLSPQAMDLLLAMTGELDKLLLFAGNDPLIEVDAVERIVSKTAEATSFLLSDAIGMRQVKKVREYVSDVLEHTKPNEYAMLFGYLVNYFRLLIRIKDMVSQHKKEKAIAKELGVHEFRVKKGMEAQRKYTMDELCDALAMMLDCDYKVKSGQWDYTDGLFVTLM
ncbi:MAG: DNA polymerase III subunit delta, partial [Firmicutes bacterium]|nr:DNA polymerase III subunit delta [Bacillota bacterium]